MRLRSILAGALALVALEAVVSTPAAAGRFGSMLTGTGKLVRHLLDPSVPAIPDVTGAGTSSSSYTTSTALDGGDQVDTRPAAPKQPSHTTSDAGGDVAQA